MGHSKPGTEIIDVAAVAGRPDCVRRSNGKLVRERIFEAVANGHRVLLDFAHVTEIVLPFTAGVFAGFPSAFEEFIRPPVNASPQVVAHIDDVCSHLPLGSAWVHGYRPALHSYERIPNPFLVESREDEDEIHQRCA